MDELFGVIALNVAEGAADFASSRSSRPQVRRERPEDQRISCSLNCIGKWDIIQEVCMIVVIVSLLIPAVVALAAINDMEEYAGVFYASGSRDAAGFLVFLCFAAILLHSISIFVRVYYIRTGTRERMNLYLVLVNLLIIIFAICFFAGGIANLAYLDDTSRCQRSSSRLCRNIDQLADCQIACFALSIITTLVYFFLCMPTCFTCFRKMQDDEDDAMTSHRVITTGVSPHVQTKAPSSALTDASPHDKPSNASTNGVPYRYVSKYASPFVLKNPPSHTSNDQPLPIRRSSSYEDAIIGTVE